MKTPNPPLTKIGRPLLGIGVLCLTLLLGACGGSDDDGPANPGNPGGDPPPAACATAHCAPTP